jgi:hypothetical protein
MLNSHQEEVDKQYSFKSQLESVLRREEATYQKYQLDVLE